MAVACGMARLSTTHQVHNRSTLTQHTFSVVLLRKLFFGVCCSSLTYDEDSKGAFCRTCKRSLQRTGVWVTKPFQNWKKAVEKMRAHEQSESHIQVSEALLLAANLNFTVLESKKGEK